MKTFFAAIAFILPISAYCADQSISKMPWPKVVRDFPLGENTKFASRKFKIEFQIPDDPAIQSAGGSGGPIVKITLSDTDSSWRTTLLEQSVGERLLEDYQGKPQIEIWGRGGGGYWTRELYRYLSGSYVCVRIDEFEHIPRHNNKRSSTAELPEEFHGKAPPDGDPTLYFIETRIPDETQAQQDAAANP